MHGTVINNNYTCHEARHVQGKPSLARKVCSEYRHNDGTVVYASFSAARHSMRSIAAQQLHRTATHVKAA